MALIKVTEIDVYNGNKLLGSHHINPDRIMLIKETGKVSCQVFFDNHHSGIFITRYDAEKLGAKIGHEITEQIPVDELSQNGQRELVLKY